AGPLGNGVPRNVLLISAAINAAAGHEVVDPTLRAALFVAGAAHDHTQLCGRALLHEGRGAHRGDETLSATTARNRCMEAGIAPDLAVLVFLSVMATAFDPETKSQNIDPERTPRAVLAQEITAAADLLSLTARRGPLGSIEMVCESLCLRQRGRLVQQQLAAATAINSTAWLLDCIDGDHILRHAFTEAIAGQAAFYAGHRFSDYRIREVCGAGIDELFPGRERNVETLTLFGQLLADHSPRELWTTARDLAGQTTG
ncbi:hypothetical protein, partial [Streptomyces sp. NPDC058657]|uniref:hypothetical protein n=1 Tax=Streptomyces sp. NPDC058657 TaxID=3346579 RepID=UPI00365B2C8D